MIVRQFGKTKVEDFDVPAPRHKHIPRFDIAVDDALGMCGIEPFGDLHGKIEEFVHFERFACDAVAQRLPLEEFHRKEVPAPYFSNLVDRADIGMSFSAEAARASRRNLSVARGSWTS